MDSDDPMMNTKRSNVVETISSTNYPTDLKQNLCDESTDEMWPLINYEIPEENEICKRMEANDLNTKSLSIIEKNIGNSKPTQVQNNKTQLRPFPRTPEAFLKSSKKSTGAKEHKKHKRVHFNSEVETFTFKSSVSIIENYNYNEKELSLENVVSDAFNERGFRNHRISETPCVNITNTGVRSRQWPSGSEWDMHDEQFHQLKRQHLPGAIYSKLKDEDLSDEEVTRRLKDSSGLKKYKSCILHENNNDKNNESENTSSWSLSRRLSISMHNLKLETKSWFEKLVTKVTKKTGNHPTQKSLCIDVGELASVSVKKPKFKEAGGFYQRNKWESGTSNLVHRNHFLQPWPSMQNLNLKRSFSLPDLSKMDSEEDIVQQEKEVKGWTKFARKGGLFQRKRNKDKSENKVSLRAWKSTKSLHYESKTLKDRFVSKFTRK